MFIFWRSRFFENYLEKVIFKIEGLDDKEVNSG